MAPERLSLELATREPFHATHLASYFAARAVAGVEACAGTTVRRTLRLPRRPATVTLSLREDRVVADLALADARDADAAVASCRRLLDLDTDPEPIAAALADDDVVGPLVRSSPGLRAPGCTDPVEIVVRAIVGQQISLAAARTVLGRMTARYGERHPASDGELTHLFPTAERLAAVDPAELPMPRARGRTVVEAARRIAAGEVALDPGAERDRARHALLAVPGIGPWTASYVVMRALGDPDAMPGGDLGLRRALERLGLPSRASDLRELAGRWRPWRTYAAHHLWARLASGA